ncbi:MAG: succinate dehydrogenase, cytochrome b556 subunit [Alphaproteobacteria bacterium]|nr:succinate dehydrogenase, cytochrome b556 subunit [Alphaproteobacteria bacterium]
MSSPVSKVKRPLSPHLQIYRPQLTSVLSITHRAAGVALAIGTLMVTSWLVAAATSEEAYNFAMDLAQTKIGTLMIFGWSVAIFYHMCNGVRHLFWDTVHLFEIRNATRAGYVVLLATALLTGATWYCAYKF